MNAQELNLKNTKWKSKSFWSSGHGIGSELYTDKTPDPYKDFYYDISFDIENFSTTNIREPENNIKQIKGKYHLFANNYLKLNIENIVCANPKEKCSLTYDRDYTQIYRYNYTDNTIEFTNTQFQDSWIDKIVSKYLANSKNENIKKAVSENYYIEWLPLETKKIKGKSYSIVKMVYEVKKGDKNFDFQSATFRYKELTNLYIQLPAEVLYEMKNGKLEEWKN